jgi:hypothetical protein
VGGPRKANPFIGAKSERDIARLIEGRRVTVITKVFGREADGSEYAEQIERTHKVQKFKQYLSAGPLAGGGVRRQDLIQFYDRTGKLITVTAEDIVL